MAVRGQDLIVRAQILVDCLGLSRGLNDDDVHSEGILSVETGAEAGRKLGGGPQRVNAPKWEARLAYARAELIFLCDTATCVRARNIVDDQPKVDTKQPMVASPESAESVPTRDV